MKDNGHSITNYKLLPKGVILLHRDIILIGLDIGNTSFKAVAFTPNGTTIATATQSTRPFKTGSIRTPSFNFDGLLEPRLVLDSVIILLKNLVQKLHYQTRPYKIVGLAVTGMGGPMVGLDKTAQPVYPAISLWPINVGDTVLGELDEKFYHTTGYHPHNSPFATLAWLAQFDSIRFARIVKILPMVSYVTYGLSGHQVTDPSLASGSGIWNQQEQHWANDLIRKTLVSEDLFPAVLPSQASLGPISPQIAHATGLPSHTQIAIGGHDYLCAASALGVTNPGTVLNMLGTYEILAAPHGATALPPSDLDLITDTHVYPNRRTLMFQVIGGGHLEWLRRMLTTGLTERSSMQQWNTLLAKASTIPESEMVNLIFAPFLFGRFFPERCIHPHGALLGLSERHGPEHITRAMIDSLSYMSMEVLKTLSKVIGSEQNKIVVTGGGTRNRLWLQRKADFLQKSLSISHVPEASALGAALLAGQAAGVYTDWSDAYRSLKLKWTTLEPQSQIESPYFQQFIHWDDVSPNACAHTISLSRQIANEILSTSHPGIHPVTGLPPS